MNKYIVGILLIPKLAVVGAAIGTLAAELGVTIYQMNAIKDQPVKLFGDIKFIKLIPAAIAPIA